MIKSFYQHFFSEKFRKKMSQLRDKPKKYFLKRKVIKEIKNQKDYQINDEKKKIVKFLNENTIHSFPYEFIKKYQDLRINILEDKDGYKYFFYKGKKIYGKKKWSTDDFNNYFRMIFIEQDKESPHCYFSLSENKPYANDVVADIGTAEGWFALSIVDICKKIYCFEADPEWIEPLRRTILPYREKIELITSYVGGVSDGTISLDEFFKDKELTYIKADIEGCEKEMLENSKNILTEKVRKALLVMYHNQEDELILTKIMKSYGFAGQVNKGYILLHFSPGFKPPYIRRGVVCYEKC